MQLDSPPSAELIAPPHTRWDPWYTGEDLDALEETRSIVTVENAIAFPFMEYANKYFRKPSQVPQGDKNAASSLLGAIISRKSAIPSFTEMISYQKKPIAFSLLNLDASLSKLAVKVFKNILNYMHPPGKSANTLSSYVLPILRAGLQYEKLRDEIYCQLYKQIFGAMHQNAPPIEVTRRAYELVAFVASTFLPSEELTKYVGAFISCSRSLSHIRVVASYANQRLERAYLRFSKRGYYRAFVPTVAELDAINRGMNVSIYVVDITTKYDVKIDSATSANECISKLSQILGLQQVPTHAFAIYETYTSGAHVLERSLFPEEIIADILSKANDIRSARLTLVFKCKLYLHPRYIPTSFGAQKMLYIQACDELIEDRLLCSDEEAIKLATARYQVELGVNAASNPPRNAAQFLPKSLRKRVDEASLTALVSNEHQRMQGNSSKDAKLLFLNLATRLVYYGATLFPTAKGQAFARETYLVVNYEGLQVIAKEANEITVLNRWTFNDITLSYTAETVTVTQAATQTQTQFNTPWGPQLYILFSDYAWCSSPVRWCRAKEDSNDNAADMLQFKKGDLIRLVSASDEEFPLQGETLQSPECRKFYPGSVAMLVLSLFDFVHNQVLAEGCNTCSLFSLLPQVILQDVVSRAFAR